MPPGLVELIESRIGALPAPVSDVVDALAVGEPIELAALRRITDPAAVEEADTRGLITLEPAVGGIEVRVAHPLYGEVRRRRAAPPAAAAARTGRQRTRRSRRPRRPPSRCAPRDVESRLRPLSRRRPAREGCLRRRLAGGSAPRRPTCRSGYPCRRGTGTEFCSRARFVVAWPRRRGRGGSRRVDITR